jgi:hypothetical protein
MLAMTMDEIEVENSSQVKTIPFFCWGGFEELMENRG